MGAESQSVARAVDILELLAEHGSLGVRDIARRMALSPTIVHRLLSTLATTGFAEQAPDTQKYRRTISIGPARPSLSHWPSNIRSTAFSAYCATTRWSISRSSKATAR
jgi:AraC-like DNA-binding protein